MIDLVINSDNDMVVRNGDFAFANSDFQDMKLMLECSPGHFRQHPLVGANIRNWTNGKLNLIDKSSLNKQLSLEGFRITELTVSNEQLIINASRV